MVDTLQTETNPGKETPHTETNPGKETPHTETNLEKGVPGPPTTIRGDPGIPQPPEGGQTMTMVRVRRTITPLTNPLQRIFSLSWQM